MYKTILFVTIIAATPLFAEERKEWNPPARFDHRYGGTLIVHRLKQSDIPAACKKIFKDNVKLLLQVTNQQKGCAVVKKKENLCVIVIPDSMYRGISPKSVLRHEVGHCNGWPSNHER